MSIHTFFFRKEEKQQQTVNIIWLRKNTLIGLHTIVTIDFHTRFV